MRLPDRPLAITDIETTGLDAQVHEIVEIAVLVVQQRTLKIMDQYHARVRPENIRRANKRALAVSGYTERDWRAAVPLNVAMEVYSQKTEGAIITSHNVHFDAAFLDAAFRRTGVEDLTDYHHIDIFSIAWSHAQTIKIDAPNLERLARALKLEPEPVPHRAINGARLQLKILRALMNL